MSMCCKLDRETVAVLVRSDGREKILHSFRRQDAGSVESGPCRAAG